MSPLKFSIVDVFAETKFAGNQLAVFTGAETLTTEEMQAIAKEMNYSETTFILSSESRNGGYDVRIFTPAKELPFAGHPTIGTAFVLQQEIIQQAVETIVLNLKVGQIPVRVLYQNQVPDVLWMRQNPPTFGQQVAAAEVAPALGLDVNEIDACFPIQAVSTGIPFLIVPLPNLATLQKIRVHFDRWQTLVEPLEAKEIFVFCPETRHPANQFSARMFAPGLGIAEDPATGSANGCFAGYLVQQNYLKQDAIDVRVEQGYEMGRPSLLLLKAQKTATTIEVSVGGKVVMIARGEFV
jgi:trans-2,3-dihydro-3-hydroxyanthranilate isomerase